MLVKLSDLLSTIEVHPRRKRSFSELCRIEPRLSALLAEIPALMPAGDFDWRIWSEIKRRMSALVGFYADCPYITDPVDYEMAYEALIQEAYRAGIEAAAPIVALLDAASEQITARMMKDASGDAA